MSRIEELPDDFDANVNINDAPAPAVETASDDGYNTHLQAPRAISSKSFEEIVHDMSRTPLFMNNLEDATDEGTLTLSSLVPTSPGGWMANVCG